MGETEVCVRVRWGGLKHLGEAEMLRQSWESWWEGGGSKERLGEKSKGIKEKEKRGERQQREVSSQHSSSFNPKLSC